MKKTFFYLLRAVSVVYLLTISIVLCGLIYNVLTKQVPSIPDSLKTGILCAAIGGIGGCVYCLRSIYIHVCIKRDYDNIWMIWSYIRPIISIICGGVSYLFLRAGLFALGSVKDKDTSDLGFYALAFIAGLNVDKFLLKIEDLAKTAWGIEKSRTSAESEVKEQDE